MSSNSSFLNSYFATLCVLCGFALKTHAKPAKTAKQPQRNLEFNVGS